MSNRTENPKTPLAFVTVPGMTRFEIATGAPGAEGTTRKSVLPFGPLMALTVRSSLTELAAGEPAGPASAVALPVPTIAFVHFAGSEAIPSISAFVQNGK